MMNFRFTQGVRVVSHTVLVIEDAVELAEVIQATLETMGITSHHETHGERGLELFKKIKPDLVLLDIALPDTKGWKILERIKAYTQETDNVKMPKVVIISAYGDPANRLMGKLQDVTRYLIKPFTPDEVERVVSGALGLRKLPDLPLAKTDPLEDLKDILGPSIVSPPAATNTSNVTKKPSESSSDASTPTDDASPAKNNAKATDS